MPDQHIEYMNLAIEEAKKAGQKDEVPIGCLVVAQSGEILSAEHNRTITLNDPSAHAEMLAIRSAAGVIENYRLTGSTLYVTIEPCVMCMGAIVHARISRVVFGAQDMKWGAAGSLYNFAADSRLNHQPEVISGILFDDCRALIQDFFRAKRQKRLDLKKTFKQKKQESVYALSHL